MPKKKKPYYPNYLPSIMAAPAEVFPPMPFDEFMDWKIGGFELPSSIACVIRVRDLKRNKTKEYTYKRSDAARKFVAKLMEQNRYEFTIVNHDAVHFLTPKYIEEAEDFFYDET